MSEHDWSSYHKPPIVDTPGAVALGHALLSLAPSPAPDPVNRAAKQLRTSIQALQAAWATIPTGKTDPRPVDTRYDNLWGGFRDRINAVKALGPLAKPKDIEAAERILGILFTTGSDFLTLAYNKQWAECDKRIQQVSQLGLKPDIDRLAGDQFWAAIETTHSEYGEVLGITKGKESPVAIKLMDPLRAAQRAIGSYLLQIVAAVDDDPTFAEAAMKAVQPVDAVREAAAKRATTSDALPPVTPVTPIPELPT